MRFRKLRIAWSVVWGVAAVLLTVLWVRSYRFYEHAQLRIIWPTFFAHSSEGWVCIGATAHREHPDAFYWGAQHEAVDESLAHDLKVMFSGETNRLGFGLTSKGGSSVAIAPHWFCTAAFSSLILLPWLSTRFTLRTLLIATTLVAVVLGLIVYAVR